MRNEYIISRINLLIAKYYKQITFSDEYITQLSNKMATLDLKENLEDTLKEKIKETVLKFLENNPQHSFLKKYLFIYQNINKLYEIKESPVSMRSFISIVLNLNYVDSYKYDLLIYIEREYIKYAFTVNHKISFHDQDTINPSLEKEIVETNLYKKFSLEKEMFTSIYNSFTKKEKEAFSSEKSKSDDIEEIFFKRIRFYFLLKYLEFNSSQISQIISFFYKNNIVEEKLRVLQLQYLLSIINNQDIITCEIEKLKKKDRTFFEHLNICLGKSKYSLIMSSKKLLLEMNAFSALEKKKKIIKSSEYFFLSKFTSQEQKIVIKIVNIMKQIDPISFSILVKHHGEDLKGFNIISKEETKQYNKIIKQIQYYIYNFSDLEDAKKRIQKTNESLKQKKLSKQKTNIKTLLAKLQEKVSCTQEEMQTGLKMLKTNFANYYESIIKRHGQSLEEWHPLESKECWGYTNAINKLVLIIKRIQRGEIKTKTLLEKLREKIPCTQEEMQIGFEILKEKSTKDYESIIKRHGPSLEEWHVLNEKESVDYNNAIKKLVAIIKRIQRGEISNKTLLEKLREKIPCTQEEMQTVLRILKEKSTKDYESIKMRHGPSLEEWHNLKAKECKDYNHALEKLVRIIKTLQRSKLNPKSLLIKLQEKIPCTQEEMQIGLEILKEKSTKDYESIIKRHGPSLEEWHVLNEKEGDEYTSAFKKLVTIVKKTQKCKTNLKTLLAKLQEKIPCTQEEMQTGLEILKEKSTKDYESIIKRHGQSLEEWYVLNEKEGTEYTSAFKKLVTIIKKKTKTKMAMKPTLFKTNLESLFDKNASSEALKVLNKKIIDSFNETSESNMENNLIATKLALMIVKARRKNISTDEISSKLNIQKEEIYNIYAKGITLFGKDSINIIIEILSNSNNGVIYLLNSESFWCLLEQEKAKNTFLEQNGADLSLSQKRFFEKK